jgi:hypothetical protein
VVSNSNLLAFVDAKLAYEIDVVAAFRAQTDGTAVIVVKPVRSNSST